MATSKNAIVPGKKAPKKNPKTKPKKNPKTKPKKKALAPSLPLATLKSMTTIQISKLTPPEVSDLLFDRKKFTKLSATTLDARLEYSGSSLSWTNRSNFNEMAHVVIDTKPAFVTFFEVTNFSARALPSLMWTVNHGFNTHLKKSSAFEEGITEYLLNLLGNTPATARKIGRDLLNTFPGLAGKYPDMLGTDALRCQTYLTWVSENKNTYQYNKAAKVIAERISSIRHKTAFRKLVKTHPRLVAYFDIDKIDATILDTKEFVYMLSRAKPRKLSPEIVTYLESSAFLNTLTGDIKYTKMLTSTMEKIKKRYGSIARTTTDNTAETTEESSDKVSDIL